VKRVHAAHRTRQPIGDRPSNPRRHVTRHQLDLFAALFAELVEEALDRLAVTPGRGPHQPAAVVIDDHGQVALALAMRYLVDADPAQPVEQIGVLAGLGGAALADTADRAPRDAHQLRDRGLRGVDRQPHRLILKRLREPRAMPRPRHRAHHHAVATARDPRRVGLHERERRAEIQRPPTPAPVTEIKAWAASPTHTAPIALAPVRPDRHDQLSLIADLHVLDDRSLQPQQPRPYPDAAHVVPPPMDSSPEEAGTLGAARRAPRSSAHINPREQQERPICGLRQAAFRVR
jgi:hypothetical protein